MSDVVITVVDNSTTISVASNAVQITLGVPCGDVGIPSGGTAGSTLTKYNDDDYAVYWAEPFIVATPAMPHAGSSNTSGTWRSLVTTTGQAATLPTTGVWAYIILGMDASNRMETLDASVANGGTVIGSSAAHHHYHFMCWRIQ